MRDAICRDWQCGTVQIDLNLPDRLDASYVNKEGIKKPPVMIHRAIFGSLERFAGILLEHYAGNLPLWLSPLQVIIATITEKFDDYAKEVCNSLLARNIKVELDLRNEKIGYKIREHSNRKIPIILIIGEKEKENKSVSVRKLGSNKVESYLLNDFINIVYKESTNSW